MSNTHISRQCRLPSFLPLFLAWGFLIVSCPSLAFNTPVDEAQGFSAKIDVAQRIEINGLPVTMSVEIFNHHSFPASAVVRLQGIDGWKMVRLDASGSPLSAGESLRVPLEAANSTIVLYQIEPATDSHSAHYPVHAYVQIKTVTEQVNLHPIAIVEAAIRANPAAPIASSVAQVKRICCWDISTEPSAITCV